MLYLLLAVQQTDAILGHLQLLGDDLLQALHADERLDADAEIAAGGGADVQVDRHWGCHHGTCCCCCCC